nr:T9SS type A sorting domain-containing protein [Bacteroidota bacterium]
TVFCENSGSADAYNVVADLNSSDPMLMVLTTQPQNVGNLTPSATGEATFSVYASPDIQPGYTGELSILFTADMGVSQEDIIQIPFADYCEATTNTEDEWIAQVICGEIDNSSGWQGAVANYTDITTTLIPGVGEPITIENGNAWASDIVYVWVDWNLDKELGNDPNEEFQLTNVGGSGQTFTGEITPPANQMNGQFRMRVRMTYSSAPVPCGNSSYGEVEDYTVLIGSQVNLDPPQNIGVSLTGNDVTISWDAPAGRDVSGYNVYRDGEMISAMVTNMYYTDMDCPDGSYWYSASAVYPEGESGIADPVQVTVGDLTGKIQGFIRDAITNALIPNAWVSALAADFGAVTYNTPFGSHFSLFLPGGTYDLVCDADGYMPQNLNNITIANGGLFSHVFYLFPESFAPDTKGNMFNHSADGSVAIYPNPATNEVNVEVIGSLQQVKIMNNLGQVVFNEITEGQSLKINTSDFLKGIYFIEIHTVEGLNTEKLVIK